MNEDRLLHIIAITLGFTFGLVLALVLAGIVLDTQEPKVKPTELQQKYEEYVKENEWKNEYIEWLQDQLYKKYEGVE